MLKKRRGQDSGDRSAVRARVIPCLVLLMLMLVLVLVQASSRQADTDRQQHVNLRAAVAQKT